MKYLIFSDESGRWNEGEYYIRSWIKISTDDYELLRKEIIFSKHETNVKELKWKNFKANLEKFQNILSVNFSTFITITKPQHFQGRKYNIIDEILKVPVSTGGQSLTNAIKAKIVSSAKNELFLNYFEKVHIENSKKAFVGDDDIRDYKYVIDTPQYLDREWESIATDCGIERLDIEKNSASIPGIELADIVSGCIADLLIKDSKAQIIYTNYIKKNMIDMNSKDFPNPNLIFFKDFTNEERKQLNIFR